MTVKLLIEHHLEFLSIQGGCTGSSESTLVKMPHCWKLHVAAQFFKRNFPYMYSDIITHTLCCTISMFNKFTTKKSSDALDVYTIKDVPPILLSMRPLEASRDEGFLIGRRELTGNVENRIHTHIRITEVAPSNSAIVNGKISIFMLGICYCVYVACRLFFPKLP